MAAVAAVEVCVLDGSLTPGATKLGGHRHQAGATLIAKGIAGFGQGLAAVGTELSLGGHGFLLGIYLG